jgi:hypothetical protein
MMVAAGRGALSIADNPAMWISATAEIGPKEMRNEDYTIGKRSDAISQNFRLPKLLAAQTAFVSMTPTASGLATSIHGTMRTRCTN